MKTATLLDLLNYHEIINYRVKTHYHNQSARYLETPIENLTLKELKEIGINLAIVLYPNNKTDGSILIVKLLEILNSRAINKNISIFNI